MKDSQAGGGRPGPGEPGEATSAASIVVAAERLAAEITRNARSEADAIRARAGSDSDAARAAVAERVRRLSALSDGMLERLGEMRAELDALSGSLAGDGAPQAAAGPTLPTPEPPAVTSAVSAPEPPAVTSAVSAPEPPAVTSEASASEPPAVTSQPPAGATDDAGARLIALNLALSDTPRDEAARQLRDQVPDPERLVDEVYASVDR
jgi:hypothetical protein